MTQVSVDFRAAHRHATGNKDAIAISEICGCFYCCLSYPAKSVTRFLAIENTALCPECTIDSVMGDASGLPVADKSFLLAMHEVWFAGMEVPEIDIEDPGSSPAVSKSPSKDLLSRFVGRFLSKKKTDALH